MGDTVNNIAQMVSRGLLPLIKRLSSNEATRREALLELGYVGTFTDPAELVALAGAEDLLAEALDEIDTARLDLENDPTAEDALSDAELKMFGALVALVGTTRVIAEIVEAVLPEFESRLYGKALADGLYGRHPVAFGLLAVAGIVDIDVVAGSTDPTDPESFRRIEVVRFKGDRVIGWLQDPKGVLAEVYGWGTPTLNADRLFSNLQRLLAARQRDSVRGYAGRSLLQACGAAPAQDDSDLVHELTIPLVDFEVGDVFLDLVPLPIQSPTEAQGVALALDVAAGVTGENQLSTSWKMTWAVDGAVTAGIAVILRPNATPSIISNVFAPSPGGPLSGRARIEVVRTLATADDEDAAETAQIISAGDGSFVRADVVRFSVEASTGDRPDVKVGVAVEQGHVFISANGSDGLLAKLLDGQSVDLDFDAGLSWSRADGVHFSLSGGLRFTIPLNVTLGPIRVSALEIELMIAGGLTLNLRASVGAKLGPVDLTVDGLGVNLDLALRSGNLGFLDAGSGFLAPKGIGIFIESSSVSGGGFLFFDGSNGRYGGAVELRAYGIDIKAFGLIETKVPGVSFSFVIVISAEFNPVQLGFGFTLDGVGGLIGINRTVNSDEVSKKLRDGTVDNILFPTNLVQNAPQIISDLAALFPAADSRYVFGPLAKLGWARLVHGTIGVILELPSKAVTLIGNINAILPKPDNAIVVIDMDIAGKLDFPKKHFELDATLSPNSKLGAYTITGDMATRIDWGDRPNFAISMGGFHSQFKPPPGFPRLRRMAIDLGINGNPSVTLQGFMALTSNTAQIGAQLDIYASYGATLTGNVGFEAMFVFSPFSFDARLWGGVHVEFLGVGFGMTLNGRITGPSPWTIDGEVCVSLWFDSACVGIHKKLDGAPAPEPLPLLDPWFGFPSGVALSAQEVPGLRPAIEDPRNWAGRLPAGALIGVSYVERKGREELVDPVGIATLRQKSVPFAYDITQYAGRAPGRKGPLNISSATVGGAGASSAYVTDWFAPGQYRKMSNEEALAAEPFEQLKAGVELQGTVAKVGSSRARAVEYRTIVLDAQGDEVEAFNHQLPSRHLDGMQKSSSVARLSARLSGRTRFIDITQKRRMTDEIESFSLTSKVDLTLVAGIAKVTRSEAAAALDALAGPNAFKRQQYQIVGFHVAA